MPNITQRKGSITKGNQTYYFNYERNGDRGRILTDIPELDCSGETSTITDPDIGDFDVFFNTKDEFSVRKHHPSIHTKRNEKNNDEFEDE